MQDSGHIEQLNKHFFGTYYFLKTKNPLIIGQWKRGCLSQGAYFGARKVFPLLTELCAPLLQAVCFGGSFLLGSGQALQRAGVLSWLNPNSALELKQKRGRERREGVVLASTAGALLNEDDAGYDRLNEEARAACRTNTTCVGRSQHPAAALGK